MSGREYEIFRLLIQGVPNKEIAYTLGIARTTVSTYRLRILQKLDVESVPELVQLAARYGLVG